MKKNFKWLAALIAAGTVIGLIIAYFCKKKNETSEFEDDFEEDFDLDGDLKPVSERGYVPLNKAADLSAQKAEAEPEETEENSGADPDGAVEAEDEVKEASGQTDKEAVSDKE